MFKPDDTQLGLLPLVGTLSSGIIYMASLLVLPLVLRYPAQKRTISLVGLIMCVGGLGGAAFATRPIHLLVTQGVIYSLGASELHTLRYIAGLSDASVNSHAVLPRPHVPHRVSRDSSVFSGHTH